MLLPAKYNTFVFMVLQKSFAFFIGSNYKWKVHDEKIVGISFVASSSSY
jgi:hypothetical protein